jgi:hypothetical protein
VLIAEGAIDSRSPARAMLSFSQTATNNRNETRSDGQSACLCIERETADWARKKAAPARFALP